MIRPNYETYRASWMCGDTRYTQYFTPAELAELRATRSKIRRSGLTTYPATFSKVRW